MSKWVTHWIDLNVSYVMGLVLHRSVIGTKHLNLPLRVSMYKNAKFSMP
jgi:hypothetical protein